MKEKFFRPEIMDKSMTPDLREQAIHPKGKVASQNDNSREARNTYSEGAAYFGGTSPLTATNVATPGGLPAFPYFAAAKYTARPAH